MKKITCLSLLLMLSLATVFAQKQNVFEKGEDVAKMTLAQQSFYGGDYQKALGIYKDILVNRPDDALVIGHIAECYYALNMIPEATGNAEKAKSIDEKAFDETSLILGKIYFADGKLDAAQTEFAYYKAIVGNGKKADENEIDMYIAQVATAKDLMAKPVDVKVERLGENINSEYDDKAPMVSADGKTLIFTSRRPGKSSELDKEGDGKYFEDIYLSHWDTIKKDWSDAELIPGSINTEGHDACTSISPDGKQIFIYKNDIESESRGGDIYVSRISSSGKWGAAKSMGKPINTTYFEGGGCLSPDGKTFYFISERQGGLGHADIYVVKRKTRTEWDKPENIGNVVNTAEDEGGLFLAPDGKTLFFTSRGHNSMGGYDIFKTVKDGDKWTTPVNLGYPINTIADDLCFSLAVDARTGYFTSNRKGGLGERDVYKVDLSNYPVLEKDMQAKVLNNGPVMAILKGDVFDATAGSGLEADIAIYDETGAKAGSTSSSEGSGEYFITLLTGKTYTVKIDVKGYKPVEEKITINAAKEGATSVVKHYLLYKK